MQEYDVALKELLKSLAPMTLREVTGTAVARWLDVELPRVRNVQNLRLDLLGQTLAAMQASELEELSERVLDTGSLDESLR